MEKQKLIYVESKALFSPSSVSNKAIVFIKDTKEIWTHGTYFICSNIWATPITLTLSGDSTGSVSIDGSGNVTLSVTNKYLHCTHGVITDANSALSPIYKMQIFSEFAPSFANGFPATNYANAIININTHSQNYDHQLGFSSNKGIYHRTRNAGNWETSWEKLLTSTNYTNFHHTFASLTNKPTTISGYGITDSIPIISGDIVTTDTDLSTLGMTTFGAKFSISRTNNVNTPSWGYGYSNYLIFRSTGDTYSGISTDFSSGMVTFIGGRNLETTANNVPNWWFRIKGASGTTYDLNSILNIINNLDSNYLRKSGGTMTGTLTLKGGVYTDAINTGALNANNSNIYGLNSLYFADASETAAEGINFYRSSTTVDSLWGSNGNLYWTPNRTYGLAGTNYYVLTSNNYTNYTIPYSKVNVTNGALGAFIHNGNLLYNNNFKYLTFFPSDNLGNVSYVLIAKLDNWANTANATSSISYGINGLFIAYRGGNMANTGSYFVTNVAYVNTNYKNYKLYFSEARNYILVPQLVIYLNEYYLAFKKEWSSTDYHFYGQVFNILPSFIYINDTSLITLVSGPSETATTGLYYYNNGNGLKKFLHEGNYSKYALPLSGGTLTGLLKSTQVAGNLGTSPIVCTGNVTSAAGINNTYSHLASNLASSGVLLIFIGKVSSAYNGCSIGYLHRGDGSNTNAITLGLHSANNLLIVQGNGNVGIGNTSPSYKLSVNGDIYSSGYVRAKSGFIKTDSSDSYVLLGGGGHKAISDFALTSSLSNYVTLSTDLTVSGKKLFSNQLIIRKDVGDADSKVIDIQHDLLLQVRRNSNTHSVAIGVMPTGAGVIWAKANGIGYNTLYLNPYNNGVAIGCGGNGALPNLNDGYYFHIFGSTLSNNSITATKFIKSGGTSSQFLKADGSLDSNAYLPLSGGTLTGALNFKNNTWNKVGDDVYIGDCNVGGMLGIKGSNADTPGFAMYNTAGTLLGKLYANGTSLYWSNAKILTSSNYTDYTTEAYLKWGGQNLASNSSPIDTILEPSLGANRLAFLSPDAIDIEYSQDGGTTWLNYNATDAQKVSLFCGGGNYSSFYLGGNSSTDSSIDRTPWRLRITISVIGYSLYCQFIKFLIYTTDVGNTTYCLLLGRKYSDYQNNVDTWVTFLTARIAGWSGWNTINHPNGITLPHTANYAQLRFEFYMTSLGTTGRASIISRIEGFAHKCWSWPSYMAGYGNIYSYDWQLNVTFPAKVTATGGFSGNLTGDVTGNLIGNADTASNISTINPILALPNESNTIQIVTNGNDVLAELLGTAAAIRHAIRFNWYNTAYEIGNVRGGATDSLGFGITYGNNNLCLLVKTNGTYSPYGFIGDLTGNAASANKWAIARTITLTGDVTGSVSLDGSSNVTLTTATSGSGTSTFLKCVDKRNSYPALIVTAGLNIGASFMTASKLGISGDGSYYDALIIRGYRDSTGGNENAIMFGKNTSSVYHSLYAFGSTTTWGTLYKFLDSGNYKNYAPTLSGEGATGTWGINISGTANKVANALTLLLNGGTTSGTNKFVYDGASAYTVNITPEAIGASATSHTHSYLPLEGGTMSANGYIAFPEAYSSALNNSTPMGITYGRILCYGTLTIAGNTDTSKTEFVNIVAGRNISEATAANGLSIGYNTLKWQGTDISLSGHNHDGSYLKLIGGTLGSSSASVTELRTLSSTAALRIMSYSDSTNYILSGNSAFTGNATLKITGYNNVTGTNLYFKFSNIYCRENDYINIDSGNYGSYALPLSGGTMTGTINCKAIVPITDNGYSIGTSSKTLYEIHANFFKRRGSSNDYVLLGGGEHKLISDFVLNYTAVVPGGSVGNNDSWTLILNNNYSTGWYNPCTMFYIRSHNFGCGILCFYHYWDTSLTSGYYDNSVWFFGAEHSAYSGTMGGTGRDINNFLKVYIDKDNDNLKIYYNRYNNLSMYILELLFSLYLAGTLYPKGLIRASHFITNGAVTDLPTTSDTFVNIPIQTAKNHTEDIKTTRSVYASAFYENSDIRLKENVHSIDLIDLLKNVDLVLFNFKNDLNKKYGVIAQQLEQVGLNNLVYEHNGNKAVDYISLLVLETLRLRNEIKELKEKLDKKELSS